VESLVSTDEDGNEEYPSPLVALLIFLVSFFSLFALAVAIRRRALSGCTAAAAAQQSATTGVAPAASAPVFNFRLPAWACPAEAPPTGYAILSNESVHAGDGAREMVVMQQQQSAPRSVVFSTYPSTANCVTPVNMI